MKTLEGQLAEYFEFQDELHPPIRVDEIDAISEPLTVDGVVHIPVGEASVRPIHVESGSAAVVARLAGGRSGCCRGPSS